MKQDIIQIMNRIVDDYIYVEDLNTLLKSFIADKDQEDSSWSQITICTHYMLGGDSPDIQRYAALTELIILLLDIIDDLQDEDQGGKPWMQSPRANVLNAVLALFMGFSGELGKLQVSVRALVEVNQILARSVNGQHKDVINASVTAEDYLLMTQEKSGSLFRLACFLGYSTCHCNEETIEHMHQLADCIGLIHQIQNDMRDLIRFDVKRDLLDKKRTLPIIYLLLVEDEAFNPLRMYYEGEITYDVLLADKEQFLHMIENSGCMEYARVVQDMCLQKAEEIFENLRAVSPWKESFKQVTFGTYSDRA